MHKRVRIALRFTRQVCCWGARGPSRTSPQRVVHLALWARHSLSLFEQSARKAGRSSALWSCCCVVRRLLRLGGCHSPHVWTGYCGVMCRRCAVSLSRLLTVTPVPHRWSSMNAPALLTLLSPPLLLRCMLPRAAAAAPPQLGRRLPPARPRPPWLRRRPVPLLGRLLGRRRRRAGQRVVGLAVLLLLHRLHHAGRVPHIACRAEGRELGVAAHVITPASEVPRLWSPCGSGCHQRRPVHALHPKHTQLTGCSHGCPGAPGC